MAKRFRRVGETELERFRAPVKIMAVFEGHKLGRRTQEIPRQTEIGATGLCYRVTQIAALARDLLAKGAWLVSIVMLHP